MRRDRIEEIQQYYLERVQAMKTRASEAPHELQELTARIERLRDRLRCGDPDMTADELQAAIDRAVEKHQELHAQQSAAAVPVKVLSILPRAAELYRRQVTLGLDGNPQAALKAACSCASGSAAKSGLSRWLTAA